MSDNQGFKEATFLQMSRRGRDIERGREAWSHSPIFMCGGLNREGYFGSKGPAPNQTAQ